MACNCTYHRRSRGEPTTQLPKTEGSLLDRFYDWEDAMEDGSCTRECGAARNDICVCRCRGLHHNAAHDYWASLCNQPYTEVSGNMIIHTRCLRPADHAPLPCGPRGGSPCRQAEKIERAQ